MVTLHEEGIDEDRITLLRESELVGEEYSFRQLLIANLTLGQLRPDLERLGLIPHLN